jgi:hypothetical protein
MLKRYFAQKEETWKRIEASMTEDEFIEFLTGMADVMDSAKTRARIEWPLDVKLVLLK